MKIPKFERFDSIYVTARRNACCFSTVYKEMKNISNNQLHYEEDLNPSIADLSVAFCNIVCYIKKSYCNYRREEN